MRSYVCLKHKGQKGIGLLLSEISQLYVSHQVLNTHLLNWCILSFKCSIDITFCICNTFSNLKTFGYKAVWFCSHESWVTTYIYNSLFYMIFMRRSIRYILRRGRVGRRQLGKWAEVVEGHRCLLILIMN